MEYIRKFFEFIKQMFIKIPIYLRGLFLFCVIVLVAMAINKCASDKNFIEQEIIRMRDEARYIDLTNEDPENGGFMSESDLDEQIKLNKEENKVNGTVKEKLNSSRSISLRNRGENNSAKSLEKFEGDYYFGSEKAPITIIEYSSYTCPNCINFHNNVMNSLKSEYINSGKVRYVKRMIIQNNTLLGVMLPYCAPDKNRYNLVEELYANADTWINTSRQKKILKEIALRNGFTDETFEDCVKNSKLGQGLLNKQREDVKELKIFYTPTIFINGEKQAGAIPYSKLKEQLEKELERLKKGNAK